MSIGVSTMAIVGSLQQPLRQAASQAWGRQTLNSVASSSRVRLDTTLPPRRFWANSTGSGQSHTRSLSTGQAARPSPTLPNFQAETASRTDQGFWCNYTLNVTSTRNNLLLTFANDKGPVFPTITAGTDKTFKKAGRASFEAGHQASLKMFNRIADWYRERPNYDTPVRLRVAYKGYNGQGGEAFAAALASGDGGDVRRLVKRVEDRTSVKIGGTRSRKPRRL